MSVKLLISNPPHGRFDAQAAATVLGIRPVEMNLKARYAVPEIWLAERDSRAVEAAAVTLEQAGMRVVVSSTLEFLSVPSQRIAQSFSFEPECVLFLVGSSRVAVAYDRPAIVMPCTPRAADGPPPPLRSVDGRQVTDSAAFIDIYLQSREQWTRLSVYADVTDFGGLAAQQTPSASRNLVHLLQQLQHRMTRARFDERLVNMQLRRRPWIGTPPQYQEMRRGYSYAAPGLLKLLETTAPTLRDISQAELSSRLAFITGK